MYGFTKLDFPLHLDDSRATSECHAVNIWLKSIEFKMRSWDISDDKDKIDVCARNLTGHVKEKAAGKTWDSYDDFKSWLRRVVDGDRKKRDIEWELVHTVQRRSFREYEKKFSALRQLNEKCLHPVSEQTIISNFLKNIRSIDLRRILQKQMYTNYDTLVEFAEDVIRRGQVKERYPSNYPPVSQPRGRSASCGSTQSSRDYSDTEPDLFSAMALEFNARAADRAESSDDEQPESPPTTASLPENGGTSTKVGNGVTQAADGWKARMSYVLVNHPLDLESDKYPSEKEAVRAWLVNLESVIDILDFKSNEEEVSFCLFNARGILAEAAKLHGPFASFCEFRIWAQGLYGIKQQKRDVVRSLMRLKQNNSLQKYVFQFKKLLAENKHCEYPVSTELAGEFFVENLRDDALQERLEDCKFRDPAKLLDIVEQMLDAGEVPDMFPALASHAPHANAIGRSPEARHVKRSRIDIVAPRTQRNVRVKPESSLTSSSAFPVELSTGAITLSTAPRGPISGRSTRSRDSVSDSRTSDLSGPTNQSFWSQK